MKKSLSLPHMDFNHGVFRPSVYYGHDSPTEAQIRKSYFMSHVMNESIVLPLFCCALNIECLRNASIHFKLH